MVSYCEDHWENNSGVQFHFPLETSETQRSVRIAEEVTLIEQTPGQRENYVLKDHQKRQERIDYIMKPVSELLGFHELKTLRFLKAIVAEILGTAILVLVGCASVRTINMDGSLSTLAVAFAFGLALALSVWAFGHISGSHVNPSVTLAFLITGNHTLVKSICYIMAQCVGGLLGAGIAWGALPPEKRGTIGATTLADGVEIWQGLMIECVATFLLVLTVMASCDRLRTDHSGSIALAIGLCVTSQILWMGNLTGGSMNPARSFGPAVVTGVWKNHWIYWLAPICGGVIAGLVYEHVYAEEMQETDSNLYPGKYSRPDASRQGFLDYTIEIEAPQESSDNGIPPALNIPPVLNIPPGLDTGVYQKETVIGLGEYFGDSDDIKKVDLSVPSYRIEDIIVVCPDTPSTSGYGDDFSPTYLSGSSNNDESRLVSRL